MIGLEEIKCGTEVMTPTFTVTLFMAGDYAHARQLVNRWVADTPMCFALSQVDYIYTFGCESGFRLDAINYPRFPSDEATKRSVIEAIAEHLMVEMNQGSYTIQGLSNTTFHTRRPSDTLQ